MSVDALILRMSIDEHHQLTRAARNATHVDAASSTCRHAIAHHRPLCDHHSRHPLHHRRQHARLVLLRQLLAPDDRHRHRQVAHVGGVACSRHHHLLKRQRVALRLSPCSRAQHTAHQDKNSSPHVHQFLCCLYLIKKSFISISHVSHVILVAKIHFFCETSYIFVQKSSAHVFLPLHPLSQWSSFSKHEGAFTVSSRALLAAARPTNHPPIRRSRPLPASMPLQLRPNGRGRHGAGESSPTCFRRHAESRG